MKVKKKKEEDLLRINNRTALKRDLKQDLSSIERIQLRNLKLPTTLLARFLVTLREFKIEIPLLEASNGKENLQISMNSR